MVRVLLLLCCVMVPALGETVLSGHDLRPLVPQREVEASASIDAMDDKLAAIRKLPPAERYAREAGLERSLEQLVVACTDTKHLNKSLYLLAAWRLAYAGGDRVESLLDRIAETKYLAYQRAARGLRVQWLLSQGNIVEARKAADALAIDVPEFAPLRDQVTFHEQISKPAPRTAGMPLGGAPKDPGTRPEHFLLYHFSNGLDDEGIYRLGVYLNELKRPEYAGVVRLVCVVCGGNPLTTAAAMQGVPGADQVDLLWASPGADGEARAWADAWKLPALPASVLLGPDRSIIAIEPAATDLRALVGKPVPKRQPENATGPRSSGKNPWGK